MRFVAIDFETANQQSDSACQVAVVVVEDGNRTLERSWLVRPKNLYFSERCMAVHGIRPRDVLDEPEWDKIWGELFPLLDGQLLLAHNASFDMAVLVSTLAAYDLACPRFEFQCTRLIARRCWPGRTGYGLKPTATSLGISFRHHDALEDARACAEVALAAANSVNATTAEELESKLSIRRGYIEGGNRVGPRSVRRSVGKSDGAFRKPKGSMVPRVSPQAILEGCHGIRPLVGRRVYLSGSLLGLDPGQSLDFLTALGAVIDLVPGRETDYWILGTPLDDASTIQETIQQTIQDRRRETIQTIQDRRSSTTTGGGGSGTGAGGGESGENLGQAQQGESGTGAAGELGTGAGPMLVISQRQLLAMIPGALELARLITASH